MEGNRNWAGIAALVLAGLALFVALDGRGGGFLGGSRNDMAYAVRVPSGADPSGPFTQTGPIMPAAPDAGSVPAVPSPKGAQVMPQMPDGKVVPPMVYGFDKAQVYMGDSGYSGGRFSAFVDRLFGEIPNLLQLIGFAALVVVGLRFFGRRSKARSGPAVE